MPGLSWVVLIYIGWGAASRSESEIKKAPPLSFFGVFRQAIGLQPTVYQLLMRNLFVNPCVFCPAQALRVHTSKDYTQRKTIRWLSAKYLFLTQNRAYLQGETHRKSRAAYIYKHNNTHQSKMITPKQLYHISNSLPVILESEGLTADQFSRLLHVYVSVSPLLKKDNTLLSLQADGYLVCVNPAKDLSVWECSTKGSTKLHRVLNLLNSLI